MPYPIVTRATNAHPVKLLDLADETFIWLQIVCAEKDALKVDVNDLVEANERLAVEIRFNQAENERLRAWGREAYIWLELCCPMVDAYTQAPESVKVNQGEEKTNG